MGGPDDVEDFFIFICRDEGVCCFNMETSLIQFKTVASK